MKSFTDIEQSKRLVEILPLDSVDMEYLLEQWIDEKTGRHKEEYYEIPVVKVDDDCLSQPITLPCWSLAALLDYLTKKDCFPEVTYTGTYYLMDVNFYDDEEGNTVHPIHFIRTEGESLVDTCVEMILKLYEEKLL